MNTGRLKGHPVTLAFVVVRRDDNCGCDAVGGTCLIKSLVKVFACVPLDGVLERCGKVLLLSGLVHFSKTTGLELGMCKDVSVQSWQRRGELHAYWLCPVRRRRRFFLFHVQ